MKSQARIIVFFTMVSCGGHITEVGNPSTTATTTATTQALTRVLENALASLEEEEEGSARVMAAQTSDGESCVLHEDGSQTCTCPGGGTIEEVYDPEITFTTQEPDIVSVGGTMTFTFNQCVDYSCGEEVVLNGELSGPVSGTYIISTEVFTDLTVQLATAQECQGLDVSDNPIGVDVIVRYDENGNFNNMEGAFCIAEEAIVFSSLEDLELQLDVATACSEE